jgi:antitoxin component YwqK of YwqJK toxin-antitoxin module
MYRFLLILLIIGWGMAALPAQDRTSEPWSEVPAWLAEIPAGLPPVVIADAPYVAQSGELPDPLLKGDVLLGLGDPREALLVIARQPLEQDGVEVKLERAGVVHQVVVDRTHLERHLKVLPWTAGGAKALAEIGITGDPASLDRIPGRVLKHLLAGGKAPWVARVVATWVAVEACAEPPAMGEPASDPFLARCEAMWRQSAVGDSVPDAWTWGVEPEFLALYLPYPGAPASPLGTLAISDRAFVATFEQAYAQSPDVSLPARRAQARVNVDEGQGISYIGQVKAALLDEASHGGWPFRSRLIWEPAARATVLAELRTQRAAGGPDRPLIDVALVGPLVIDNHGDELLEVMEELRHESPALARRAFLIASGAAGMHASGRPAFARLEAVDKDHPFIIRPQRMALYQRCRERSNKLFKRSAFSDYDQVHGHPATLRGDPAEVARICSRWWDMPAKLGDERQALTQQLNSVAWWMGVHAIAVDGAAAREVVDQLRHLGGRDLPHYILDTVAADLSKAGDFPTAVRFQQLALSRRGSDGDGYSSRLKAYERRETYLETDDPAIPDEEKWPNGIVKSSGMRTPDHQRIGWWRTFSEDGILTEEQLWLHDQPHGVVRRFHDNGRLREIGIYGNGVKVGRWRTFDVQGRLLTETWWSGQPAQLQTGWSATWHANGALKESGAWISGQKEGFWRTWGEDGTPASAGLFDQGEHSGPWRTWTGDGQATDRNMGKEAEVSF